MGQLSDKEYNDFLNYKFINNLKSAEFKKFITKYLTPKLHELGFTGSGFSFQKISDNCVIQSIQFFGSKYGGEGYLEVGVHLGFLPDSIFREINPKKINTIDSFIRKTLFLPNENQMIDYGTNETEAKESIDLMYEVLKKDGFPFFDLYTDFPKPFDSLTLEDLKTNNEKYKQYELRLNWIVTTLNLSRINLWLGNKEKAFQLAQFGLTQIEGKSGSGLRSYFERILKSDMNFCTTQEELDEQQREHEKLLNEMEALGKRKKK
jgi:hypothetical protein